MKKSLSPSEKKPGRKELLRSEPLWIGQLLSKADEGTGTTKRKKID